MRNTRAANMLPTGRDVASLASSRAILQAKREAGGTMRFPDHASYLRHKRGLAQIQLRQQTRLYQQRQQQTQPQCDSPVPVLASKGLTTEDGLTIGGTVEKDMDNEHYTNEFDPFEYQSSLFPDLADFIDENIVRGDKTEETRLNASYWSDLGNDVFDDWGYFFLYDSTSNKYYFPLIYPQNQDDGVITTQHFTAFDRNFTIKHGWVVEGIFKFDISVEDCLPFRFGAYGNMGSDGDEETAELTSNYTLSGNDLTLHYRMDKEEGDDYEVLYSYFIPYRMTDNETKTVTVRYDSDDMSMITKEITKGVLIYFSKANDVKDWVLHDLEIV